MYSIIFTYETVRNNWVPKAKKLSVKVRQLIRDCVTDNATGFSETHALLLLKFPPKTQDLIADVSMKYKLTKRQLIELLKKIDLQSEDTVDEMAKEIIGFKTVEVKADLLTTEQKEIISKEKEKEQEILRKLRPRRIRKKETITKTRAQEHLDNIMKKSRKDMKFVKAKVSSGTGTAPPLKSEVTPYIEPTPPEPDFSLCQCASCSLWLKTCKGRCWNE